MAKATKEGLVWRFDSEPLAGVLEVPEEVRQLWDTQMSRGQHNDIFEIEGVGPLVILENYPELLMGRMWLHSLTMLLRCLVSSMVHRSAKAVLSLASRGAAYSVWRCSPGLTGWIHLQTLWMGFPGEGWLARGGPLA